MVNVSAKDSPAPGWDVRQEMQRISIVTIWLQTACHLIHIPLPRGLSAGAREASMPTPVQVAMASSPGMTLFLLALWKLPPSFQTHLFSGLPSLPPTLPGTPNPTHAFGVPQSFPVYGAR